MERSAEFHRWKEQCLSKADLSRKGSVDEDVVGLVQLLNAREQFFTTSSCAGRVLLLDGVRSVAPRLAGVSVCPGRESGRMGQTRASRTESLRDLLIEQGMVVCISDKYPNDGQRGKNLRNSFFF
jgi:hypothetical protein